MRTFKDQTKDLGRLAAPAKMIGSDGELCWAEEQGDGSVRISGPLLSVLCLLVDAVIGWRTEYDDA